MAVTGLGIADWGLIGNEHDTDTSNTKRAVIQLKGTVYFHSPLILIVGRLEGRSVSGPP